MEIRPESQSSIVKKEKRKHAIMMTELEQYYNKFNEEKRLDSRHGKVEFITSMKYIHEYLGGDTTKKILDIGAGTGKILRWHWQKKVMMSVLLNW